MANLITIPYILKIRSSEGLPLPLVDTPGPRLENVGYCDDLVNLIGDSDNHSIIATLKSNPTNLCDQTLEHYW